MTTLAGVEVIGACPLDCPDTCSWVVTVEDGEAVRLRGNRDHPFTRGALCAKVNGYLEHTRAPDRLLHPLRRVGAKGEGRFARISWDEALDEIAGRLQSTIDRHGGEAIWPFQGTGTLGFIQGLEGHAGRRLWNILGASRHRMTACSVAGRVGAEYTTGTAGGMDPETFADSKLILLWGTNPLTSGHHMWKYVLAARKAARTSWRSTRCARARPTRPTSTWRRCPARTRRSRSGCCGWWSTAAPRTATTSPRTRSAGRSSARASSSSRPTAWPRSPGCRRSGSSRWASGCATTRPTAIRATMGMQRHAGGGMALRTLYAIPGVTGDWQYPGGGACYSDQRLVPREHARAPARRPAHAAGRAR